MECIGGSKMSDLFLEADGVVSEATALSMSLRGALQRNRTYRPGVTDSKRKLVCAEWKKLISGASQCYAHSSQTVSDNEHCQAIGRISEEISRSFADSLFEGRLRFGSSQKALNLYLKYMWRLNIDTYPPPPHCPIDGIVLAEAGISGSWTRCDSAQEYMSWIDGLRKEAKTPRLAEWEYHVWLELALKKRSTATHP
jgi:hypothetical protein